MPAKPVIPLSLLTAFMVLSLTGMKAPAPAPERELEIVATDYAFRVPDQLTPGPAVIRFKNAGNVRHELNVSLLKNGVTVDQFMQTLWAGKPVAELREGPVGVLFAKPGTRSGAGLETNLKAGRDYVIICIFRDSAGAKRHYEMGMYSLLHITNTRSPKSVGSRVDTIIGTDYAFKYKPNLKSGPHFFAFANKGKQRHEVFFGLLKPGVSVDSVIKVQKSDGPATDLFDEVPGLLAAPGGITALGNLRLTLLPGREYMIQCNFQDSANALFHYELGMYGSIKVAKK